MDGRLRSDINEIPERQESTPLEDGEAELYCGLKAITELFQGSLGISVDPIFSAI